jgi:hypothetical protein
MSPIGGPESFGGRKPNGGFATLAVLGRVKRAIGDLDRIAAWLRMDGFVLTARGLIATTNVANGCSRLIAALFGDEIGKYARIAIGVAAIPLNCPVVRCSKPTAVTGVFGR